MAHIASRSPSPNPSRSQSPSTRGPNAGRVVKKVPWVNPCSSGHAIFSSLSAIPQRNLGLKGGSGCTSLQTLLENDENDHELNGLKLNKVRSPAAAPSKGTKNFMSPTISASSKITAASPKRKILSERNDGPRLSLTSVSDSFNSTELEECDPKFELDRGPQVSLDTPKVLKASPEQVESERGGSKLFGSFNIQESHWESERESVISHASPVTASLDEDPSLLPPYDPKTNYLSPRPRFLHYRPRQRIEHYLNRGDEVFRPGDERQLEDRLSSESTEETREETEETQSSDAQSVPVDDPSSSEVETGEVRSEAYGPEPKTDDHISLKATPRSHFFRRSKFMKFFLVMAIACLSFAVIDTPSVSSFSVLKHKPRRIYSPMLQIFDDPYIRDSFVALKEHADVNFEKISNRFGIWTIQFISQVHKFFPNFAVPKVDVGFFYHTNITATEIDKREYIKGDEMEQKKDGVENDATDVKVEKSFGDDGLIENADTEAVRGNESEQGVLDSTKDDIEHGFEARNHLDHQQKEIVGDIKEGLPQSYLDASLDSLVLLRVSNEIEEESEANVHYDNNVKAEKSCSDDGFLGNAETEVVFGKEAGSVAEQSVLGSSKDGIEDGFEARNHDIKGGLPQSSFDPSLGSLAVLQPSNEAGSPAEYQQIEISNEIEEESEANVHYDNNVPFQNDGAYISAKESQASTHYDNGPSQNDETYADAEEVYGVSQEPQALHYANFVPRLELPLQTVLGISSVVLALVAIIISLCVRQKHIAPAAYGLSQNKVVVPSCPPEAETMGESGPSEVSSTVQNTTYFGQMRSKRHKEQDTYSHERNLRRDSVASSTSYGSFTTYEKLSGKKGYRDEDSLTPVRRSSRIRSQITSP